MSIIIGNKSEFAIEYSVESISETGNLFGYTRLWIRDIYIGNFDEVDYLSHLQFKLKKLLENYTKLENAYLNNFNDEELIEFFKKQKTSVENYDETIDIDRYYFGRVPAFDDFCVLCLYASDQIRFTWKLYDRTNFSYQNYPLKAYGEKISLMTFEKVVSEFYELGPSGNL